MLEIPKNAIDKFVKWNLQPFKFDELFDKKIVEGILVLSSELEKLGEYIVDDDVAKFVNGMYIHHFTIEIQCFKKRYLLFFLLDLLLYRTDGDFKRMNKIEMYIKQLCDRLHNKY